MKYEPHTIYSNITTCQRILGTMIRHASACSRIFLGIFAIRGNGNLDCFGGKPERPFLEPTLGANSNED